MQTVIVRLWLPDRPGALGQVASRIGAVRGDVVGIDILERDGGRAIDELVVELPDNAPLDLLVAQISEVDGVDVEEIRPVAGVLSDPRLDALETAAILVGARDEGSLLEAVVVHGRRGLSATWAVVMDLESAEVLVADGPQPEQPWLAAFLAGSRASAAVARGTVGPDDVAWAPLPAAGLALVVGRDRVAFRARERRQVATLARIVDSRFAELARSKALLHHPSTRC